MQQRRAVTFGLLAVGVVVFVVVEVMQGGPRQAASITVATGGVGGDADAGQDSAIAALARARIAADVADEGGVAGQSAALTHLVLVPGHAIFSGTSLAAFRDESSWALESFQHGRGLVATFLAHIKRGFVVALSDPAAVLVFSGGQTRPDAAARSEAASYLDVAVANSEFFDGAAQRLLASDPQRRRVFCEDFARDSFENVLFSIARFYEVAGRFPDRITVIGFEYKRLRFVDYHRKAIRWPVEKFTYIGIDPSPPDGASSLAPLSDANTLARVKQDLYMCRLGLKTRKDRNPNKRSVPYYMSVPASVARLLLHCGPGLYSGPLPWAP